MSKEIFLDKLKQPKYIAIVGGIIIVIVVLVSMLTGNNSNNQQSGANAPSGNDAQNAQNNNQANSGDDTNLGNNIISSGVLIESGELIVFVTNHNSVPVDMKIEVEFYDADGKVIETDLEFLEGVNANYEIAWLVRPSLESFDNYKILVEVEKTNKNVYFDSLEVTHNDDGEEIDVEIKNNSQETVKYIKAAVVYYNKGVAVGIDVERGSATEPGEYAEISFMYPFNDKDYNDIDFDSYKVVIIEAYSY